LAVLLVLLIGAILVVLIVVRLAAADSKFVGMGFTRVPVEMFERGQCPKVCVVSGAAGTGELNVKATKPVGAAVLLLLLGIVPFIIYWAITRRVSIGVLPLSNASYDEIVERRRQRRSATLKWAGGGVGAGVLLAATPLGPARLVGTLLFVGSAVVLLIELIAPSSSDWLPFRAAVDDSGRWLQLAGVHPAFAEAVDSAVRGPADPGGSAPTPVPQTMPAGWYADPLDGSRTRWWDGSRWSDYTS
jgi:hypothetical protein